MFSADRKSVRLSTPPNPSADDEEIPYTLDEYIKYVALN
jgi:hypothetical protein